MNKELTPEEKDRITKAFMLLTEHYLASSKMLEGLADLYKELADRMIAFTEQHGIKMNDLLPALELGGYVKINRPEEPNEDSQN